MPDDTKLERFLRQGGDPSTVPDSAWGTFGGRQARDRVTRFLQQGGDAATITLEPVAAPRAGLFGTIGQQGGSDDDRLQTEIAARKGRTAKSMREGVSTGDFIEGALVPGIKDTQVEIAKGVGRNLKNVSKGRGGVRQEQENMGRFFDRQFAAAIGKGARSMAADQLDPGREFFARNEGDPVRDFARKINAAKTGEDYVRIIENADPRLREEFLERAGVDLAAPSTPSENVGSVFDALKTGAVAALAPGFAAASMFQGGAQEAQASQEMDPFMRRQQGLDTNEDITLAQGLGAASERIGAAPHVVFKPAELAGRAAGAVATPVLGETGGAIAKESTQLAGDLLTLGAASRIGAPKAPRPPQRPLVEEAPAQRTNPSLLPPTQRELLGMQAAKGGPKAEPFTEAAREAGFRTPEEAKLAILDPSALEDPVMVKLDAIRRSPTGGKATPVDAHAALKRTVREELGETEPLYVRELTTKQREFRTKMAEAEPESLATIEADPAVPPELQQAARFMRRERSNELRNVRRKVQRDAQKRMVERGEIEEPALTAETVDRPTADRVPETGNEPITEAPGSAFGGKGQRGAALTPFGGRGPKKPVPLDPSMSKDPALREAWKAMEQDVLEVRQAPLWTRMKQSAARILNADVSDFWDATNVLRRMERQVAAAQADKLGLKGRERAEYINARSDPGIGPGTGTTPAALADFAEGSAGVIGRNYFETGFLGGSHRLADAPFPSLKAALQAVGTKWGDFKILSRYAVAKRAVTRFAEKGLETKLNATDEQLMRVVAEIEGNPAYAHVVDALETIRQHGMLMVQEMVDSGLITAKQARAMEQANPYYIRFIRQLERGVDANMVTPGKGKGMANLKGPRRIRETPKGELPEDAAPIPLEDPIAHLAADTTRLIGTTNYARSARALTDLVRENPEVLEGAIREISPEVAATRIGLKDIERALRENGVEGAELPAELSATLYRRLSDPKRQDHVILSGGKWFEVSNPALLKLMHEYEGLSRAVEGTPLLGPTAKGIANVQSMRRTGITGIDPRFWVRQVIMDLPLYYLNTVENVGQANPRLAAQVQRFMPGVGRLLTEQPFTKNFSRNLVRATADEAYVLARKAGLPLKESVLDAAYRSSGAELGGFFGSDRVQLERGLDRLSKGWLEYYWKHPSQTPRAMLDTMRAVGQMIESVPRKAEFMNVVMREIPNWKPGDPIPPDVFVRASNAARNVTVNFKRGSETSRLINRYGAMFFNPWLQGHVTTARMARHRPAEFFARQGLMMTAAAALWLYNREQGGLDNVPEWRRYGMWNLRTQEGELYSLPIARETHFLPKVLEGMLDAVHDRDPDAAMEMAQEIASMAAPPGASSTVIGPVLEVGFNRKYFSGSPVRPEGMEDVKRVAPEHVAFNHTTESSRILASWMAPWGRFMGIIPENGPLSAADIDHLMASYGGRNVTDTLRHTERMFGMGETNERPQTRADLPVVGFVFPRPTESRALSDFREAVRDVFGTDQLLNDWKRNDPEKFVEGIKEFGPKARADAPVLRTMLKVIGVLRKQQRKQTEAEQRRTQAVIDKFALVGMRVIDPTYRRKTSPALSDRERRELILRAEGVLRVEGGR